MQTSVKIVDPHAAYLDNQTEIDAAIERVVHSGWYLVGKELATFEEAFARWCGTGHAIGVANGTDALELALRALGVGQGDAVLTVSHTAVATATAIVRCGAVPVFVDIDAQSYTMCPIHLQHVIDHWQKNHNTPIKAIVPVHLYGQSADMPAIMAIARQHGLYVVEDCAQAHGARCNGQMVGTFGDLAALSFYPTKNLGAMGDAGAVITSDVTLAQKVRCLREYGWEKRYVSSLAGGINSRMDEMQAAILDVKLNHLSADNRRRRDIAALYHRELGKLPTVMIPRLAPNNEHVYHLYVIQVENRENLREKLAQCNIATGLHYPLPVHLQPAFMSFVPDWLKLPITELIMPRILSLPMYPQLPHEQVMRVCECILDFAG